MKDVDLLPAAVVGLGITYFTAGHFYDMEYVRYLVLREARTYADSAEKPLLNVGCGPTDWGDVNVDIDPQDVPNFVQADAQDLFMFSDKQFGAVFASHVLEHLDDPRKALEEWHRVADRVFICLPSWWNAWSWAQPQHKWTFPLGLEGPWIRIR